MSLLSFFNQILLMTRTNILDDFFNGLNDTARGIGEFFGLLGDIMIVALIVVIIVVVIWLISLATGHGRG